MKSEPAEQAEATGANPGAELSDPFAVDLFAANRTPAAAQAPRPDDATHALAPSARDWQAALPKVSRDDARRSSLVAALPPALPDNARQSLARTLSRLTRARPGDVRLDAVGLRETAVADLTSRTASERAPRVVLTLSVEPEGAPLFVELDAGFAAAVVDRLLGGDGATPALLRPLSTTECAVIEFFFLCVVHELNALAGEPLFRLEHVGDNFPSKLAARVVSHADESAQSASSAVGGGARVLVATVRAELGSTVGLARLVFGEDALAALGVSDNPLYARAGGEGERLAKKLDAYKKFAGDVGLRLLVGETRLDALNVAELECGDIVIVERPALGVGRAVTGQLSLVAGAGRGVVIGGVAGESSAGAVTFVVESIRAGGNRAEVERVEMQDKQSLEAGGAEGAAALEGLLLTLHVELPARRISLEELSRLRAGQILELGCRPTDPVELVADGRRVASGELVDIEGRLGVRVTRLLG